MADEANQENNQAVRGGVTPEGATPESVREGVVNALLALLDLRRPQFGAHCRRVTEWCCGIGQLSGLSAEEMKELEYAALLHDIGFVVVGGEQLANEYDLGKRRVISTHELAGYSVLSQIPGFARIAEAVLHHHEVFDGSGRPQKLRGGSIPLMSRIISVADAYDHELFPGAGTVPKDEEGACRTLMRLREQHRLDPELVSRLFFVLANLDPIRRKGEQEYVITPTALTPGMMLSRDFRTFENVLLLKADTVLSREMINRLLSSEKMDWLVTKVYVNARSIKGDILPAEEKKAVDVGLRPVEAIRKAVKGRSRASVLVLDDSQAVCNAIRRELGREGIEVIGAVNIVSAISLLETHHFDAAITDLVLVGEDGFSFLSEVKEKYPALHVVVLSGFPSEGHIHALKGFSNVVRFIAKPWSEKLLRTSVEEAILMTRSVTEAKGAGVEP
jgi:response regulator RpfG family c-di-GMP phosphodiesterase